MYDLFIGVCLSDLFMEKVEVCEDWYLFDFYEVCMLMGYLLEDFYDEEEGSGLFCICYVECVNNE